MIVVNLGEAYMQKKTLEEFVLEALDVHGGLYSYYNTEYTGAHKSVTVTCDEHGDFTQIANNHLRGVGCSKCADGVMSNLRRLSKSQFIIKASDIHANKYNYDNVVYINNHMKVQIDCPEHGTFHQVPISHLAGSGCPSCATVRRNKRYYNEPTTLYYVRFATPEGFLYKAGITMSRIGISERFRKDKVPYTIVKQWEFSTGKSAYQMEQMILNDHKEFSYTGKDVLKGGNSELFTKDVLNLDTTRGV